LVESYYPFPSCGKGFFKSPHRRNKTMYNNQINVEDLARYIPQDYIKLLKKYGIRKIKGDFDQPLSLQVVIEIIKIAKEMDQAYPKTRCT
jgi:hypothetical protein